MDRKDIPKYLLILLDGLAINPAKYGWRQELATLYHKSSSGITKWTKKDLPKKMKKEIKAGTLMLPEGRGVLKSATQAAPGAIGGGSLEKIEVRVGEIAEVLKTLATRSDVDVARDKCMQEIGGLKNRIAALEGRNKGDPAPLGNRSSGKTVGEPVKP